MKTTSLGLKKEEIIANLENPEMLEKMYQSDRKSFKAAFEQIYREIEGTGSAKFWKARLDYPVKPDLLKSFDLSEIVMVLAICLLTAVLIKIPELIRISFSDEIFYMKNAAIIVFFGLTLYTIAIRKITEPARLIIAALAFLLPAVYVNLLPSNQDSDTLNLVYIHLPLLMWFFYGMVFSGYDIRNRNTRIDFIRYNGDLAIIYALVAIAGGILTGITIGLFDSIGMNIEKFYSEFIIITGAAAAPVVASYIIEKYPALVNKTAPVIAGIFSPMVLLTLVIFLATIFVTGKDPYNDREFLLTFNIMLLGVMGIIIFSVSETSVIRNQNFNTIVLTGLSIITIIIDLIALSAIFYRLGEYGLTPNRLAVLVSNILILANLVLIMIDLFGVLFKKKEFKSVELTVSRFLPVYLLWIVIVVFGFPLFFGI